jgi:hypothetical protein
LTDEVRSHSAFASHRKREPNGVAASNNSTRQRVAGVAFVLVLVSPALRNVDSFPLSTQPMYASARSSTARLATVIGRGKNGAPVRLSMRIVGATDDPLIAQSAIAQSIRNGRAKELCQTVANRIAEPSPVGSVEVVWETVDVIAMSTGVELFGRLEVAARCNVRDP